MSGKQGLLVRVLLAPADAIELDAAGWDLLIRQARSAELLPRLALALRRSGAGERVPEKPARHLDASLAAQRRLRQAVRWEVEQLRQALGSDAIALVLLKGAAYEMAALPPAESRLCNDIDILVPRGRIEDAELALLMHGWATVPLDGYDQRYYRRWMHELPPMRHHARQSVVDVHHNLVPDTARIHPDPQRLLEAAVPCPGSPGVHVLAPADMILHSAVHLFNEGEFDHGLRDLFDIDDLVRHFLADEDDWRRLVARALELDLDRPLFYALRYLRRLLGATVPDAALAELSRRGPSTALLPLLDAVFERGLRPDHASCNDAGAGLARWALFVRGHFLRMPLRLLLPHLARKALVRTQPQRAG